MRLAPRVLVRGDILGFGEICGARILRCTQVTNLDDNPVRRVIVHVTAMIVWRRRRVSPWEKAGERIDPRPGTQTVA